MAANNKSLVFAAKAKVILYRKMKTMCRGRKRYKLSVKWGVRLIFIIAAAFTPWYITCLPAEPFGTPNSTVLLDKEGKLLGAKVASDGQWRFCSSEQIPAKFETCLLEFEDRNFYHHPGISLRGIARALYQNIKSKKVKSGGSTITMQVARLIQLNPPRTVHEKIIEMFIATRLEIRYTKKEILGLYCANAPFGNNVVGLDAAAWRYYGRTPETLGWAECAALAVLPNAPGLIYPGKNHYRLLQKRNRLLKRLFDAGKFDKTTLLLALAEPLPEKPLPLPRQAPHLLARLMHSGMHGKSIHSSIDANLQARCRHLLQTHYQKLSENKIYNGAILVSSVRTGKALVYIGNTQNEIAEHSPEVDCISAQRSTGSILKPFLYEKCLEDGILTPSMLLPDVPTHYGSFSPKNFTRQYDGAVAADKALARSLNIPMVRLLNEYGLRRFHLDLRSMGLSTLRQPSSHYGLSLILGGAEARLDELNNAYLQWAQQLRYGKTKPLSFADVRSGKRKKEKSSAAKNKPDANQACIYSTLEAMVDVNRPDEDGNWRVFSSSQKIAWKTGTSFGSRDAWAIGITPDYVVSVWIGNADGEGRPGLSGIQSAAPLMFDVFNILPRANSWFAMPVQQFYLASLCAGSGHRASPNCDIIRTAMIPKTTLASRACPYHRLIHLDANARYRVDSECENVYTMQHKKWFVLPPLMEKYYKPNHPSYRCLPEFKSACLVQSSDRSLAVIYPKPNSRIYVPVEIDGRRGSTVFEATHRNSRARIFWHLDEQYLGETEDVHQLALQPLPGEHTLLITDEKGASVTVKFESFQSEND